MKQVFVVYETDAWHTIANRDCKGIYTSKRSAINAIVKNHEIDLEEIFEDDRLERASRRVLDGTSTTGDDKAPLVDRYKKTVDG